MLWARKENGKREMVEKGHRVDSNGKFEKVETKKVMAIRCARSNGDKRSRR